MTITYSIEQVEQARIKILENAFELIIESELLYDNGKYARAYTLSHLACEELFKIPMIVNSMAQSILYGDTNWKKLNKRLIRHNEKFKGFLISNLDNIDVFLNLLNVEEGKLENRLNNLKNDSLYSGIYNGEFKKPSEIITEEISSHMISLTKKYYEDFYEMEKVTKGKLKELQINPEYKNALKEHMDLSRQFPLETWLALEVLRENGFQDIKYFRTLVETAKIINKNNLGENDIVNIVSLLNESLKEN